MNKFLTILSGLMLFSLQAAELQVLSAEQLKAKVAEITQAQNKVMLKGSTRADVDQLFALYSDDFVYRHDVYGGNYSKKQLYDNTLRLRALGKYDKTAPVIVFSVNYRGTTLWR